MLYRLATAVEWRRALSARRLCSSADPHRLQYWGIGSHGKIDSENPNIRFCVTDRDAGVCAPVPGVHLDGLDALVAGLLFSAGYPCANLSANGVRGAGRCTHDAVAGLSSANDSAATLYTTTVHATTSVHSRTNIHASANVHACTIVRRAISGSVHSATRIYSATLRRSDTRLLNSFAVVWSGAGL